MWQSRPTLVLGVVLVFSACREPTAADRLDLSVSLDRLTLAPLEVVQIRLHAVNRSDRAVRFSGSGSSTLWAEVLDQNDSSVVQFRGSTDDLRTWTVEPDDTATITTSWDGRARGATAASLPAGSYSVVGRLTATEFSLTSEPVALTLLTAVR